jgi:hypothetical protein
MVSEKASHASQGIPLLHVDGATPQRATSRSTEIIGFDKPQCQPVRGKSFSGIFCLFAILLGLRNYFEARRLRKMPIYIINFLDNSFVPW